MEMLGLYKNKIFFEVVLSNKKKKLENNIKILIFGTNMFKEE